MRAPARYKVQSWRGDAWLDAGIIKRQPAAPTGHRANLVAVAPQKVSRIRVILVPQRGAAIGMTELEAWGR